IPGQKIFSMWFKHLFVNLLMFPLVIALILISNIIIGIQTKNPDAVWQPPFLYGIDAKSFSVLVGTIMLFIIPDLLKTTKAALGIKDSPLKVGLSTLFGGATGLAAGAYGGLSSYGHVGYALSHIPGGANLLTNLTSRFTGIGKAFGRRPRPQAVKIEPGQSFD
ncbi:MAG: hypothetical protein AAB966_04415, partial [Patescibacteria group bacterium]